MALTYKKSDRKTSRAYMRSKGMEPNPGVSHLAVVGNPGRRKKRRSTRKKKRKVSANPFQWIEGRGQGHRHVSPEFASLRRAASWKKRHSGSSAKLYPVDERGTIVSRPIKEKLLSNGGSEDMSYNIKSLRRAMRTNPRGGVSERETARGVRVASKGRRRKTTKRRSSKRRKSVRRNSRRRVSRKPVRRNSRRRSSRRRKSVRKNSRRRSSRRRRSRKPVRRNSRRKTAKRSSKRRTSVRRNSRRRSSRRRRSRSPMGSYMEAGYMPAGAPRYRTGKSRSGIPPVLVYPTPRGRGKTVRRRKRRTTMTSAGKRRRSSYVGGPRHKRGRRRLSMTANRRRSSRRRSSRRSSRRRTSVRKNSRRRSSRRRSSRRLRPNLLTTARVRRGNRGMGRPVGATYQVLAYGPGSRTRTGRKIKGYPVYVPGHVIETAAVRRYRGVGGAAKDNHARAVRRGYKEHKKYKTRRKVRKNSRRSSMRKNRRRSRRRTTRRSSRRRTTGRRRSRRSSLRRNSRRRSSRRGSRRRVSRNPRYVVVNRRRRRRVRKNGVLGSVNWTKDVGKPILGGTAGFIGARVLSNGLANISAVSNILDKDKPASEASNTKIAANILGIIATLGLATKVKVVRDNQGAIVTGMGLALADRLLGRITGPMGTYLGEYVNQPLGEYVNQPLGAYVSDPSMGEYVNQPLGDTLYAAAGLGAGVMEAAAGYPEGQDPADQAGVDSLMDVMEATAGMGTMYATAGMGTMYATAGMGEADAMLEADYAAEQPPFASIQTPTSGARIVKRNMPYADPVPQSLVTPEGRGYAGGLFARQLFAGML